MWATGMTGLFDTLHSHVAPLAAQEETLLKYASYGFIAGGISQAVFTFLTKNKEHNLYYGKADSGIVVNQFAIPARVGWIVMEAPSMLWGLAQLSLHWRDMPIAALGGVGGLTLHYLQRTLIYPNLMRNPTPMGLAIAMMSFAVTFTNGFAISRDTIAYSTYTGSSSELARVACGAVMFLAGFAINIHSDYVLRNLRPKVMKPGDPRYKIPRGGMFEYVTSANYFGEILEWAGIAVMAWNRATFSFLVFTFSVLACRAVATHEWYKNKFDDYPANRRVIIPFLF